MRPATAAALVYAVLAVLFVSPALLPGKTLSASDTLRFSPPWLDTRPPDLVVPSNMDLGDGPEYMDVFLRYAAREMPDVPLWNPYIVGGRPFAGNNQSALFSPYTALVYVLPFWTALGWIAVLKIWFAAFGTYLLGRSLGMRFGGALLAGIVFALNLKLASWLIYTAMGVWTWYPWMLLCVDRLVKRPDLLSGAGLALVTAVVFLTGHAESSIHAVLLGTAFFAFRLWQARRAGKPAAARLWRPLVGFAGGVAGGVALAALTLLPFVELLLLSADLRDRAGESVDLHLPLKEAIGIFLPDYWGRPTQTPLRPIMLERAMYLGALPLMLAAAALVLRPTRTRVMVALFGALWLLVVLGVPPFLQVITRMPLFSSGHNSRLIVFTVLAAALLAGWGLDDLTSDRLAPRRRRLLFAVAAALFAIPVVVIAVGSPSALGALRGGLEVAWLFADPPGQFGAPEGEDVIRASALLIWLAVAVLALALLWLRTRGRLGATAFIALAVALVCVDLFRVGMGQNPAIDRDVAEVPETGAVRFLERQGPGRFVSTDQFPQNVIPMDFGVYEGRGYDLPIVRRYDRFWRAEVIPGAPSVAAGFLDIPLRFLDPTPRSLRALRLLGVTHILGPVEALPERPPFDRTVPVPPLSAPGLSLEYEGRDARVYGIAGALPRAFVVGAQRVVSSEAAALAAVAAPGFDARRVAVTESRLPGLPERTGSQPAGEARISLYQPERVVVRARSRGEGLLVLSDNQYPGWKAKVDGRDAPIERVDYLMRGVRIGPGRHTVEFRYEPLSWRIGWITSALALAGLALAAAVGRSRRRGTREAPVCSGQ